MLICHIAPFAPNRCGLYESARDMARADIQGGNDVVFVDAGVTIDGKRENSQIGVVDDRAGFKLQTSDNTWIDKADVIIMHTGISDSWLVKNQTPLIWVVHGRPLACFRPERMNDGNSYSLYQNVAQWKRTKKMLYFWEEYRSHWSHLFNGKDLILPHPVIDETRFNNNCEIHKFKNKGACNILICDSERIDIDLYELVVGILKVSKKYPFIKFHFTSIDLPLPNCWNLLLGELQKQGSLGDISGRLSNMEQLYKASDCVISPNKIITRTIGESLSCGTPVISQSNKLNFVSDYTCDMSEPDELIDVMDMFIKDFNNGIDKQAIIERSKVFSLSEYSKKMNDVYQEVISC